MGNVLLLLSIDKCPSNEPLVNDDVVGFIERSVSDIVRESKVDCWEFNGGSREVVGDNSRGMFEVVGKIEPGPEYNDDGIVVPFANIIDDDVLDDEPLNWEILLRICWFNKPRRRRWSIDIKDCFFLIKFYKYPCDHYLVITMVDENYSMLNLLYSLLLLLVMLLKL